MAKSARPRGPCVHCGRAPAYKPRGLCWRCYQSPENRAKYSRPRTGNGTFLGLGFSNRPLPAEPTDARPGSEYKLRILCERAAAEVALWHPDDATFATGQADAETSCGTLPQSGGDYGEFVTADVAVCGDLQDWE